MESKLLTDIQIEELLSMFDEELKSVNIDNTGLDLTDSQSTWYNIGASRGKTEAQMALIRAIYKNKVINTK